MKHLKNITLGMVVTLGLVSFFVTPTFAYDPIKDSGACKGADQPAICKELDGTNGKDAVNSTVTNVINILLYVVGIITVIMIIVGGIKYTTSNGDSSGITSAKNTILYAVIGLVVALMAYAIVNFVIGRI